MFAINTDNTKGSCAQEKWCVSGTTILSRVRERGRKGFQAGDMSTSGAASFECILFMGGGRTMFVGEASLDRACPKEGSVVPWSRCDEWMGVMPKPTFLLLPELLPVCDPITAAGELDALIGPCE